jgi:hypothetical protein
VAWVVAVELVVGVVVGGWSVVLVEVAPVDVTAVEVAPVDADEAPVRDALTAGTAVRLGSDWAARAAKRPTPASDPPAMRPVMVRVRRNHLSRAEGVVMPSS